MTRRVVAVIQARLGSSRFPRKSLAMFRDRPMIEHVIQRVQQVPRVDEVVVAVPTVDKALAGAVRDYGSRLVNTDAGRRPVRVVCGPEQNVLLRLWMAAVSYRDDVVMRITGDCPVWSPRAGTEVLRAFLHDPQGRQFWSNDTTRSGWPDGTDTEVFSMDLLSRARHARKSLTDDDREHVTTWMKRTLYPDLGLVRREQDKVTPLKLSVDTRADLLALENLHVEL